MYYNTPGAQNTAGVCKCDINQYSLIISPFLFFISAHTERKNIFKRRVTHLFPSWEQQEEKRRKKKTKETHKQSLSSSALFEPSGW